MVRTFQVDNIRCNGCANTITSALEAEGFTNIHIDLSCEPRTVTVGITDEAQVAHLRKILIKLGYPFSDEEIKFSTATTLKAKSFVSCSIGKFKVKDN